MFESQGREIDGCRRKLSQLGQITFPGLSKRKPKITANTFDCFLYGSKVYLLAGLIMVIDSRVFAVHHKTRVFSFARMMKNHEDFFLTTE